jgi:hypothetical protein
MRGGESLKAIANCGELNPGCWEPLAAASGNNGSLAALGEENMLHDGHLLSPTSHFQPRKSPWKPKDMELLRSGKLKLSYHLIVKRNVMDWDTPLFRLSFGEARAKCT